MLKNNQTKKLIVLGVLMEIIYLLFYFVEPLRKILGDDKITLSNSGIFLSIVLLLLMLIFLYTLAFKQIKHNNYYLKILWGFILVFSITCLFLWPIGSTDVFTYINQIRVSSAHHANPYTVPYSAFPDDALYYFINTHWTENTSPYGPLFIGIGRILALAGGSSLILTLFIFKLFFVSVHILNCLLIYKIFKDERALLLYGWNPLIIYEFAINGHNDVLIIFFLLLSVFFLLKKSGFKNHIFSWMFLLGSVLIKYITVIFAPIFLLVLLAGARGKKERVIFLSIISLTSALMFFVFFFPYWQGWQTFSGILSVCSPPNKIFSAIAISLSAIMFCLMKIPNPYYWGRMFGKIIFIFSYVFILLKMLINFKKLTKNSAIKYSCLALAIFLASFLNWVMPWYFTVLIALLICYLAAYDDYKKINYVYAITLFGVLCYVVLR
ncbi:hypothetical protein L6267_03675 [Candidatus Parcubacteria bacterium]|nr:hypothetical protein [Candidatus Parcubacteria bacterium]